MTYTDQLIDRYDQTVDDEYERLVLHRASSVSVRAIYFVTLILMAVLAWVLPGLHSLWAFTLLLPLAVGEFVAQRWMSTRTARPRALEPTPGEIVFIAVTLMIAILGYGHGAGMLTPGFIAGALAGGTIGMMGGILAVRKRMSDRREKDTARLNADLDD